MSFDPMSGPPQRPRSTPIPDPDRPGQALPPPTPAQFLGEQPLPWTPKPGPDVNAPFSAGGAVPGLNVGGTVIVGDGGGGGRRLAILVFIMLVVIGTTGAVIAVTRNVAKTVQQEISRVSEVFPAVTAATTAPVPTTLAATVVPIAPSTAVTAAQIETTMPTPPPTTVPVATGPPPPISLFPGGGTSVYDAVSTRAIADQLELALAGEPTQFTQIILLGDKAVATAQDPAQPSQQIGAYWQDGAIGNATITSSGGGDITPLLFTEGEVNWEAVAGLVAGAPGQLNMADGQVTSVVVQRAGRGNPIPIVIDVYVNGSGGERFLEAAADGSVIGLH